MRKFLFGLALFITVASFANSFSYRVVFFGLEDRATLEQIKESSSLLTKTTFTPQNIQALRYFLREDLPIFTKILHSNGYYDAKISYQIEEGGIEVVAYVLIDPGVRYDLSSFSILDEDCNKEILIPLDKIDIELDKPAIASTILQAKDYLLYQLSTEGFPLAKIEKEKYIAEKQEKKIYTTICVDKGPFCYFGSTSIDGLHTVKPRLIARKLTYKEGGVYSIGEIESTRKHLIDTELFSSVIIDHAKSLDAFDQLPMNIHLTEAKHQTFSAGVSYATVDGFGVSLGWVHRNMRGMGERMAIDADISQNKNVGMATYAIPDFGLYGKEYVLQGQAVREDIYPYLAFSYSLLSRIDQNFDKNTLFSYGIKGEFTSVHESANNGKFWLISIPVHIRHTTANHLLNPTKGYQIIYNGIPYKSFSGSKGLFFKQMLTGLLYIPTGNSYLVLASRLQLGSITGAPYKDIPMTKLFLGGSDDDLRGYKYRSVSPKNQRGKPIGGRSVIYYTFEPRLRISRSFGIVLFADLGNIRKKKYPTWKGKWHKSVGLGLRYFSFFGPIRLDVAHPLNRSKHDHKYRVYVSLGQTF